MNQKNMFPSSDEGKNKKIALVTGSATGIGANVAIDLAASGYLVIVTGRDISKMNQVVDECERRWQERSRAQKQHDSPEQHIGGTPVALHFRADLNDVQQIDKLVEFIRLRFGRISLLVINACYRGDESCKSILDCKAYEEMKKVMHINVFVPLYLIHKCVIKANKGSADQMALSLSERPVIISISSIASKIVVPLHLYSISKACLSELTRQIARMSEEHNLYAVTIAPGPVLTNERPHHDQMRALTLMDRVGGTQEISDLVVFVANNAHLFNGKELDIDGGYKVKQLALTKCFY